VLPRASTTSSPPASASASPTSPTAAIGCIPWKGTSARPRAPSLPTT
jgi:hypothetical protein